MFWFVRVLSSWCMKKMAVVWVVMLNNYTPTSCLVAFVVVVDIVCRSSACICMNWIYCSLHSLTRWYQCCVVCLFYPIKSEKIFEFMFTYHWNRYTCRFGYPISELTIQTTCRDAIHLLGNASQNNQVIVLYELSPLIKVPTDAKTQQDIRNNLVGLLVSRPEKQIRLMKYVHAFVGIAYGITLPFEGLCVLIWISMALYQCLSKGGNHCRTLS